MFKDRMDAAKKLAVALEKYKGQDPLVLAIPRGSVEMGIYIARALKGEFDIVLVRKLRTPDLPEFAIGAIDERGWVSMEPNISVAEIDEKYIEEEKRFQLDTLQTRRKQYEKIHPTRDPHNRIVIVVDDGLATGSTMVAALLATKSRHPKKLICAVPISLSDSMRRIEPLVDEVICLEPSAKYFSVSQGYETFEQVSDETVIKLLTKAS